MPKEETKHIPVLMHEVLDLLAPQAGESYLDLTAGQGGHAGAILELTKSPGGATLVDRDLSAVKMLRAKFKDAQVLHMDFLAACQKLHGQGRRYDMILADLGVSSQHLESGLRGFSFSRSGPLDMRMDPSQSLSAEEIVNTWSEADLADIFNRYGEERKSRQIARNIVAQRPIQTTDQLAAVVAKTYRFRGRIHPATRTFQALRIAVNDELNQLALSLPLMLELLAPGGRLAIISFHSLEDRLVKQSFKQATEEGYEAEIYWLAKKPVTAAPDEIVLNPRARSAKLRAVAKIKK